MESLGSLGSVSFLLAGLAVVLILAGIMPWFWHVAVAISLAVPAVMLLALDRIIEVLTDIRDALTEPDDDLGADLDEETPPGR